MLGNALSNLMQAIKFICLVFLVFLGGLLPQGTVLAKEETILYPSHLYPGLAWEMKPQQKKKPKLRYRSDELQTSSPQGSSPQTTDTAFPKLNQRYRNLTTSKPRFRYRSDLEEKSVNYPPVQGPIYRSDIEAWEKSYQHKSPPLESDFSYQTESKDHYYPHSRTEQPENFESFESRIPAFGSNAFSENNPYEADRRRPVHRAHFERHPYEADRRRPAHWAQEDFNPWRKFPYALQSLPFPTSPEEIPIYDNIWHLPALPLPDYESYFSLSRQPQDVLYENHLTKGSKGSSRDDFGSSKHNDDTISIFSAPSHWIQPPENKVLKPTQPSQPYISWPH